MAGYRSIATLALTLCLLSSQSSSVVRAQTRATSAGGPTSVTSGQTVVYPTRTVAGANPNGVALVLSNSNASQAFYIRNTGTFAVTSVTLGIAYSLTPGTVTIRRCNQNVAFLTATTCASGSATVITGPGVITLGLAAGFWFAFRIDPANVTRPTITVTITHSQLRAAVTTNS